MSSEDANRRIRVTISGLSIYCYGVDLASTELRQQYEKMLATKNIMGGPVYGLLESINGIAVQIDRVGDSHD